LTRTSLLAPRLTFVREIYLTSVVPWVNHILKYGKSFREVEKIVEAIDRGRPANSSNNTK
ncbi:MAG: hypothetical protein QGI09_09575, partial [Dehalococcoidia bacterium]|nr:hypothetical protein [Dehalococcoidia bacterium]